MVFEEIDANQLRKSRTNSHFSRNEPYTAPIVKFLIITRVKDEQQHLISILTTNGKIVFHSMSFSKTTHHITPEIYRKITRFIYNFKLTENSIVIFQDTIDKFMPLKMYLYMIRPFAQFKIENLSMAKMMKRIYTFRKSWLHRPTKNREFTLNSYTYTRYINLAWNKLVESNECQWINSSIDMQVRLKSLKEGLRMKIQRLMLFYAIVRLYFQQHNRK